MIALGILDRSSPLPLHEQLARGVRAAIVDGRWGAGEVVPSTRALAADLGVARGTVVAAYEILAGEGYLLTRAGGRTTVALRAWHPVPAEPALAPPAPVVSSRRGAPRPAGSRTPGGGRPGVARARSIPRLTSMMRRGSLPCARRSRGTCRARAASTSIRPRWS